MNIRQIRQPLTYLLLSLSAGIIEFLTFTLLTETTSWPIAQRQILSLCVSVLWNFTLNRRFTFRAAGNLPVAMLKAAAFYLFFLPFSSFLIRQGADFGINEYILKISCQLLNFILEFSWWKFFVFRNQENSRTSRSMLL